ncbi:hypothetical protein [Phenylobacterium sp.]|jgi:hypothetical protein|uniref:hypothetical protein n=1 Tax=Phenylobacterium sp. TaxID=1871053 RepID=UPI002F940493
MFLGFVGAAVVAAAPCAQPAARALDFWVGRWTVTDATGGQKVGDSVVAPEWGGCAIREQFTGTDGFTGGSLNAFDAERGLWRQFGAGSTGAVRLFEGSVGADGALDLRSEGKARDGSPILLRMVLRKEGESVRQTSTLSRDGGVTWRPRYDFRYAPAA